MNERILRHWGVLGMHWGVRKKYQNKDGSLTELGNSVLKETRQPNGFLLKADGTMVAPKGTNFQRLTYSAGVSRPLKDVAFVSINDFDNARYIKELGFKKKFLTPQGRDQILTIKVKKEIKAPSLDEATRLHSELLLKNPEYQSKIRTYLTNESISKDDLNKIQKNPSGKEALSWYREANIMLAADKEWYTEAPYLRETIKKEYLSKGWDSLRDENDSTNGMGVRAPMIIFDPEKSLKVVRMSEITDAVRLANDEKLKAYAAIGKKWTESRIYN